jgi:hypothetical protein
MPSVSRVLAAQAPPSWADLCSTAGGPGDSGLPAVLLVFRSPMSTLRRKTPRASALTLAVLAVLAAFVSPSAPFAAGEPALPTEVIVITASPISAPTWETDPRLPEGRWSLATLLRAVAHSTRATSSAATGVPAAASRRWRSTAVTASTSACSSRRASTTCSTGATEST